MAAPLDDLLERAGRRWESLAASRPDLGPAIDLQRHLLGEMIATLGRLDAQEGAIPTLDRTAAAINLGRGLPVLHGVPVDIPVELMASSLDRFCQHLAEGGAGDAARHLLETLEAGRLNRGSLLSASLARSQRAIEAGANQMGLSPDLVWLVGELATAPLANRLQQRLFGDGRSIALDLRSALDSWDRGYCPACGSWPALIEYIDDGRWLRCSFCAAAWELSSPRCVYCGEASSAFSTTAPDPGAARLLLEACTGCRGYTKAIRVERPAEFPLVAIEDLETLALDQAAMAGDYVRPTMPELEGLEA